MKMKKKKNPYQAHLFNFKRFIYDVSRWFGWPLFLWFRVKKQYVNKKQKHHIKGGAMVISNHILYSDPMVLHCTFWDRRLDFVITDEITRTNKFKKWLFTHWGCIPVDRDHFSLSYFREIVQRLEGGNLIAIFPEGHVSFANENPMSPFKSGAVLMAYQANVPIIPVYREIRENIWKRQRVLIGEPVDIKKQFGDKIGMKEVDEISKYLFEKENELKEIYHELNKGRKK